MRKELINQYNNPYPVETAIFELEYDTPLAAEVTRSLFHTQEIILKVLIYTEKRERLNGSNLKMIIL